MIQAPTESVSLDPPTFDPYDYAFHEDPYPTYRRLREEAPLYYNPDLNFWACRGTRTSLPVSATTRGCPARTVFHSTPPRTGATLTR